MEYSLAKKLKDAGFPQKERIFCDMNWPDREGGICMENCPNRIHNPTLSELIEACGDRFINLKIDRTGFELPLRWAVFGEFTQGNGNTPEEAVANLWLKLNENKKIDL